MLGLSRLKTYELVQRQGFPAIRFGQAIRVPRDAFSWWLEEEAQHRGAKQELPSFPFPCYTTPQP
jgi:excisionase family DNA binding protein